ncbi:MAG: hypothetical protein JWP92_3741 [Caulobacter sp.]|nr:hypothetical protein [Caulobacter sp.]
MAYSFPTAPAPETVTPTYRDFSGKLVPPGGGQEQRIARLGDRWAFTFVMPTMDEDCLLRFAAVQTRARAEGEPVRMQIASNEAAPTGVTGAGSINSVVVVASTTVGIGVGWFFSFESGGRVYPHQVTAIEGDQLSVAPRLRATLSGPLNFAEPEVEGFLDGTTSWDLDPLAHTGITFTISEDS